MGFSPKWVITAAAMVIGNATRLPSGPALPPVSHVGPCRLECISTSDADIPLSGTPNAKVCAKFQAA